MTVPPVEEPTLVYVEHDSDTIIEVVEAPPGPPGTDGPTVHFGTAAPDDDDGNVGDFWIVVAN